ncbi:MAG: outer membrane beta-barrel protein [Bacteroidales bacterium]
MVILRHIVLVLFIVSINNTLYSQSFVGGLQGGCSASQIDNDAYLGYKKWGITAGMFVGHKLYKKINAQYELRFNQKGASEPAAYYRKRLDYIEMPISANYVWKKHLFLEGGYIFGFLLREKNLFMLDEDFAKFDLPFFFGIGYKTNKKILLNMRYTRSLFPIAGSATSKAYWNDSVNFVVYYSLIP